MTPFEVLYTAVLPFEHPLYQRVHRVLRGLIASLNPNATVLDVGGRKSNYTIGQSARVWISDIPRTTALQSALDLGATDEVVQSVTGRRSNIDRYVIDDMTESRLPDASFDIVIAIEVIEHVDKDSLFIKNVRRVLKSGGCFLMTTPNGDHIPVPQGDHKRHYRREQLRSLLLEQFDDVDVRYCVRGNWLFGIGLRSWSLRRPFQTLLSMAAYFLAYQIEQLSGVGERASGTLHLIAVAKTARSS